MHKIERTLYARLRDPNVKAQWEAFLTLISGAPTLFDALVFLELIGDVAPDDAPFEELMQRPLRRQKGTDLCQPN